MKINDTIKTKFSECHFAISNVYYEKINPALRRSLLILMLDYQSFMIKIKSIYQKMLSIDGIYFTLLKHCI